MTDNRERVLAEVYGLLRRLAEVMAVIVRRLIREEGERKGLWPAPEEERPEVQHV